jgi:hypothetical protein
MMPIYEELDDARWETLRDALQSAMAQHVPAWTAHNDSDPGVTLVQLFAFLAENLLVRIDRMPERGVRLFEATIAALVSRRHGADTVVHQFSDTKRVHFFSGQLLNETDLNAEQQYHRQRRYLHNRALHGSGLVNGLEITVSNEPSPSVTVEPGLALDALGRELQLTEQITVALETMPSPQYVLIEYAERKTDFVPLAGQPDAIASRIEEGVAIQVRDEHSHGEALAIARLVREENDWTVDTSFAPTHVDQRG